MVYLRSAQMACLKEAVKTGTCKLYKSSRTSGQVFVLLFCFASSLVAGTVLERLGSELLSICFICLFRFCLLLCCLFDFDGLPTVCLLLGELVSFQKNCAAVSRSSLSPSFNTRSGILSMTACTNIEPFR